MKTKPAKLTQSHVDIIDCAAGKIKDAMETAQGRMDGNGQFMGESCADVFDLTASLEGAPKRKVGQICNLLARIQGMQCQVEMLCEDIEQWASDYDQPKHARPHSANRSF